MVRDAALPGAVHLLEGDPRAVLAPALVPAGGTLRSARPTQVIYEPGRRLTIRLAAEVTWADGSERTETLGAVVDAEGLPGNLALVEGPDGASVGVWRYPHDPWLPGLSQVASPPAAAHMLAQLGFSSDDIRVQPRVYRPGRRAVLRVEAGSQTVYVRALPPHTAEQVRNAHDLLAGVAPVPRSLTFSGPLGLVVVEGLPGLPLTRPLVDGGALPRPDEVLAAAETIATAAVPRGPVDHGEQAARHAGLLAAVEPTLADQAHAIAGAVAALDSTADRTVHGDFYEGQLLVVGATVTGLLDVDGLRRGSALDDPASLVAHLVALAHVHPSARARIDAYRHAVEGVLAAKVEREPLRLLAAARLLGIATMPFRRCEPEWRARTAAWLDQAGAFVRDLSDERHEGLMSAGDRGAIDSETRRDPSWL